MTFSSLKINLIRLDVPERYYSFKKELKPDKFYLIKNGVWEFYYLDERGGKIGYRQFKNENEACDFFYEFLTSRRSEWDDYR